MVAMLKEPVGIRPQQLGGTPTEVVYWQAVVETRWGLAPVQRSDALGGGPPTATSTPETGVSADVPKRSR